MPSRSALVSFAESTGVLPVLTTCFGTADRARGVERQDLADDEPVEEHPERREVLLDGRRRERSGELLDVGRDHHGLDLVESDAAAFAPFGEAAHGREVGEAGVGVPDVGGEELPEAALGALGGGEERRRRRAGRGRDGAGGGLDAGAGRGTWRGECTRIVMVHKGRYVTYCQRLRHPGPNGPNVHIWTS